jgi:hypothetical protein
MKGPAGCPIQAPLGWEGPWEGPQPNLYPRPTAPLAGGRLLAGAPDTALSLSKGLPVLETWAGYHVPHGPSLY